MGFVTTSILPLATPPASTRAGETVGEQTGNQPDIDLSDSDNTECLSKCTRIMHPFVWCRRSLHKLFTENNESITRIAIL